MPVVFILFACVQATVGNRDYGYGQKHGALVFVETPDREAAMQIAADEIAKYCWRLIEVEKSGIADPERLKTCDADLQDAYAEAIEDGWSMIVYSEPISEETE